METETIELTHREKIIYYLICLILAVIAFVSTVTIVSLRERDYQIETQKNLSTVIRSLSDSILKEESLAKTTNIVNVTTKASSNNQNNIDWNVPAHIITEAEEGDVINIINQVANQEGNLETASVMVRKLEGDTYRIVNTDNQSFTATIGTYKYYYTHNGITKEVTLKVTEEVQVDETIVVNTSEIEVTDNQVRLVINTDQEYQQITMLASNALVLTEDQEKSFILVIDITDITSNYQVINFNIDNYDYQVKIKINNLDVISNTDYNSTINNSTNWQKT